VKGFNAPGRYSRSPSSLTKSIKRETSVDGVSFGFVSEVAAPERAAAIPKGAGPGWTVTQGDPVPGKGECAILTKDQLRKIIFTTFIQLSPGGGKDRLHNPIVAPTIITEAPSGRKTLFTMAHLPAHIEALLRLALFMLPVRTKMKLLLKRDLSPALQTYVSGVLIWKQEVMRLAAEHHVDDIVVGADWNVSAFTKWVRELFSNFWPGLNIAATKGPDLGKRNVGWLLTSMDLVASSVHRSKASDHLVGRFQLKHVNPPAKDPKPVKPPLPFDRCTYNGALMDQKTKTAVQLGEKRLGYSLTILQGCYHPGVSQSAGTHDGGQVIDFAPFDFENKVRTFRKMGWFIWHRLAIIGVWGEHIHGGLRNGGTLSPSAARQQDDYDAHPPRDGLAGHSLDPTWHPKPPVGFDYAPSWHEVNP
jgi:hypothetical protein